MRRARRTAVLGGRASAALAAVPAPAVPPQPPLPADAIVGGDYMPFVGDDLLASEFMAAASATEFRAAVRLWWAAWSKGRPTGSLPNNDRLLAEYAGYARDARGWKAVRAMALYHFEPHADGQLYHSKLVKIARRVLKRRGTRAGDEAKAASDSPAAAAETAAEARGGGDVPAQTPQDGGNVPARSPQDARNLAGTLQAGSERNQGVTGENPAHGGEQLNLRESEGEEEEAAPARGDPPPDPAAGPAEAPPEAGVPPDVAALAARLAAGTGWSPEETAERAANWLRELDGDACKLRELLTTAERVRPRAPSQWMAGAITKALEVKAARAAALSRAVVVAAGLRRAPPPRAEALARFEDGVRGNTDPRRARFAAGKAMARLRARREQVEAESMNGETGA